MADAAPPGGERASTGIPGLDSMLAGGLPPHCLHLVEGDPGTGKTTLALQFLLAGRARGEPCVYVSLSETTAELRTVAASHGWSLDGIEIFELNRPGTTGDDEYTLYHPSEIELADIVKRVLEVTDRTRPSRLVLDSLSEMRLLARDPLRYRRQILLLKEYFAGRACTVLLLDHRCSDDQDKQLRSIAHAVILLEQASSDYGRARRRLRLVKVRGVAAVEGYHDFRIRSGGLSVFPQLTPARRRDPPMLLHSGLPELDALLGGGLTSGTCTLFIGPAGAGKSTLAAQYVSENAGRIPCALFLFDERGDIFLNRADALGMNLSALVRDGRVSIEQVEPGELSAGEFAHRVADCVSAAGAGIVLLDSLNGYLNAIHTGHPQLVRLHELLAYLNDRNVATLLIAAQHGVIGTTMTTPIDVSYLADCVVLQRFFEAGGAVRRAMSVVKKRTGSHEATIREFAVGPTRVRLGQPLTDFHGILTGIPQYRGPVAVQERDGHLL